MRAIHRVAGLTLLLLLVSISGIAGPALADRSPVFDPLARSSSNILLAAYTVGLSSFCNTLASDLSATGATVDYHLRLDSSPDGQVAAALAAGNYDQVWVLDLSQSSRSWPTDMQAIAQWYQQDPTRFVVMDARIAGDLWNDTAAPLVENYVANVAAQGGGIVCLSDHSVFSNYGMNNLLSGMGFSQMWGYSTDPCTFDPLHPLMSQPNVITQITNDYSGGFCPYNLQPNGRVLYPVSFYSPNGYDVAISATFPDGDVVITEPADGAYVDLAQPVPCTATAVHGFPPYTFEWSSDIDGPLGTGESILVMLSHGTHLLTCRVTDSQGTVKEASVTIHPIEDDPTATESTNWGAVKALYRN